MEPLLTRNIENDAVLAIAGYEAEGGYAGMRKALKEMSPADLIETVKKSKSNTV